MDMGETVKNPRRVGVPRVAPTVVPDTAIPMPDWSVPVKQPELVPAGPAKKEVS